MQKYRYIGIIFAITAPPIFLISYLLADQIDWGRLIATAVILTTGGIWWDMWATKRKRRDNLWVWRFNHKNLTGVTILSHPLEEYIFGLATSTTTLLFFELTQKMLTSPSLNFYYTITALTVLSLIIFGVILKIQFTTPSDA